MVLGLNNTLTTNHDQRVKYNVEYKSIRYLKLKDQLDLVKWDRFYSGQELCA